MAVTTPEIQNRTPIRSPFRVVPVTQPEQPLGIPNHVMPRPAKYHGDAHALEPAHDSSLPIRRAIEHLQAHPRRSPVDELQLPGGGIGEVDDAALHVGTAIVDA